MKTIQSKYFMEIERLHRVSLRDVWKNEAYDFTPWLEENIDILGEAIDLNLVNVEREKKTESIFSVDLIAEDEATGGIVVIENQLQKSDHDHLGKLITYLTAMQAQKAVWIVSDSRPEHVAAINWLNESTNADFYLLKIEAVGIGESNPAPLLTVIVGPSEIGKSVGRMKQETKESHRLIEAWFKALVLHPDAELHKNQIIRGSQPYLSRRAETSGSSFNYRVRKNDSCIDTYIDLGSAKKAKQESKLIFKYLLEHKDQIEKALGDNLIWEEREKSCIVRTNYMEGGYESDSDKWWEYHDKLTDQMNRLYQTIHPLLKSSNLKKILINAPALEEPDS